MHHRLTIAASLAILCGCASSDFMRLVAQPAPLTASPDQATIVFLRPRNAAPNTLVTIIDEDGRFLGDSLPSACFAARVQPGRHVLVGLASNTAALQADVEGGRVYYVEVVIRLGSLSSRAHLFAVHPGKDSDASLLRWWRECDHYDVDTDAGQRSMRKREAERIDRVRRAKEQVARFSAEDLARRSLAPQDGRVP